MPESKKYWYIQLNVNFFDDERIDWLCEQKNGYAYVVLYLKLCLKTANNNGILTRQIGDMIIPYNVDKIAEITHINVDIVRVALELYKRIGLVYESDENCNFMRLPEVPGMVGYTTQAAIEKAKQRERKKQAEARQLPDNCPDNCPDNVQQELRVKSLELIDNNKNNNNKEEVKRKRFSPPTFDEIKEYCKERKNTIDPKRFYDFYSTPNEQGKTWVDSNGKPVRNWKQKIITWEGRQQNVMKNAVIGNDCDKKIESKWNITNLGKQAIQRLLEEEQEEK